MSTCRGPNCKQEIRWAKTAKGKAMPLDTEVLLKEPEDLRGIFVEPLSNGMVRPAQKGDPPPFYRTHYATCPDAARFSGKSRDEE